MEKRVGVDEIAKIWGVSRRRVLQLCKAGKVYAAKIVDGKWSIPSYAEKPVDGRRYRNIYVPPKHMMVLQYADNAVIEAQKSPTGKRIREDAWNRFVQDSAFHMHTVGVSDLSYSDVRDVLADKAVGGKSLRDQVAVLNHKRALEFVRDAAESNQELSIYLLEEMHSFAKFGASTSHGTAERNLYLSTTFDFVNELNTHPIARVATLFTRLLYICPFPGDNERIAYLAANFMLMKFGYPPIILYRAIFPWWRKYIDRHGFWDSYANKRIAEYFDDTDDEQEVMLPDEQKALTEPKDWDAHINGRLDSTIFTAIFAKAVRRSCRLGFIHAVPYQKGHWA